MTVNYWPILPAAGVGSRMRADRPKQYLTLQGQYLIDHTLTCILTYPLFKQAVLVLSEDDSYWPHSQYAADARIIRAAGGAERCYSVLNGLKAIAHLAKADDWVLVHDVARPCLTHQDLDALLANTDEQGAILAVPVRDTMKRANGSGQIDHTVERKQLWHALTPQKFRYQTLLNALEHCLSQQLEVTDEASALEQLGVHPALVEGSAENIKVTRPEDLALADFYLSHRR